MKAYYNTRLHQTMGRNVKCYRKRALSFLDYVSIPNFSSLRNFKLRFNTIVFLTALSIIGLITWAVMSLATYIEYKKMEKFRAEEYVNEILIPYEAKIHTLEQKIEDLEAHALEVVYFKKFIPTRHYVIKGGTKKQRANFRKIH